MGNLSLPLLHVIQAHSGDVTARERISNSGLHRRSPSLDERRFEDTSVQRRSLIRDANSSDVKRARRPRHQGPCKEDTTSFHHEKKKSPFQSPV